MHVDFQDKLCGCRHWPRFLALPLSLMTQGCHQLHTHVHTNTTNGSKAYASLQPRPKRYPGITQLVLATKTYDTYTASMSMLFLGLLVNNWPRYAGLSCSFSSDGLWNDLCFLLWEILYWFRICLTLIARTEWLFSHI